MGRKMHKAKISRADIVRVFEIIGVVDGFGVIEGK